MQVKAGAVGLSLAKTSEAEVFAKHGFTDLFVAYPVVSPAKAERLVALSRRVKLCVGVDSIEGASILGEAASRASFRRATAADDPFGALPPSVVDKVGRAGDGTLTLTGSVPDPASFSAVVSP